MVVYLYKKGRQTMKNIITTIAMFILTITAQAQTITTDSFYQFTHDTTISTFDASDKNQCKNIGWVVGKTKYDIFEDLKNPDGNGIRKGYNIKRGKFSLDDILKGKYPDYPVWKLKQRLLLNGYMLEKCNNCGFEERRVTDAKVPLVLDFLDGDKCNHLYDNLRMLCFNCSFLLNGNLTGPKKEFEY